MPILFITAMLFAVITVVAVLYTFLAPNRRVAGFAAAVLALVTVIVALGASITVVPTREVGVELSFGKPVRTLDNGIHWKAPWHRVVDMDGTIQIDDNLGDKRTEIRLGNQSTAFVQNSLRWSIKIDAADTLYADYRDFDKIQSALVEQELAAALNVAFADYDPLSTADKQVSYDDVTKTVRSRLQERVGDRVVIHSLIIPKVDFDEATQRRIDAVQAEIGNTRIAQQRKLTAAAEADANRVLATSVSKDPNVLVSKCLDLAEKGVKLPAGFSCWPDGDGAPVVTTTPADGGE